MQWFRSHHGAPTDNKLGLIAQKKGIARPVVIAVWWYVLDYASQNTPRGTISGLNVEEAAFAIGADEADIEACLAGFQERSMIDGDTLTAWDARQPKREDDSSERVKRLRDKKKSDVTPCNADETHGNAPDTDTEQTREDSPNPPSEDIPPAKKATRLPKDWTLPSDWKAWALQKGVPDDVIEFEAEKFADAWHADNRPTARKLDWEATWRNWIRRDLHKHKLKRDGPTLTDWDAVAAKHGVN